ncbi:MAG: protein kinase [Phycisphaerales bacterium]
MSGVPQKIGPYAVHAELGRGGMGVVYHAVDTRLDRAVAIKALPDHLADDPDRLARFEREARTLAALNHPNVAGIHGVEEADDRRYLVLELVEGETLAERLDRGALAPDEAIEICAQIAAGVEAAHEAGVIHRDLKPGNVKITPDGRVKVLDFGLAKASPAQSSSSIDQTHSPTMTTPPISQTVPGAILGTAPYMSPEQARGRAVDHRSDIWSFGVVLYECLTGASPFMGETATDSIGAILHKDVDLDRLPPATPPNVRRVIERCLERDKRQRLQAIGDARIELERPAERAAAAPARRAPAAPIVIVALLGAALGVAGTIVGARLLNAPAQRGAVFASVEPPPGARFIGYGDLAGPAAISPDGARIVFTARDDSGGQSLWLRSLNSVESRRLPDTTGATFPFWSPDSRSIGFFEGSRMRRLDLATGTVRAVCETRGGRGGAWMDDDTIVFSPSFQTGLFRVPASGGEPQPLTVVDESQHTSHRWPTPIPGTDRFIYIAVSHDPDRSESDAIYLASLDGAVNTQLISTPFCGQVVDGQLLFLRDNAIVAAPIDIDAGVITGDPVTVVRGVQGDRSTWHGAFSADNTGRLVHVGLTATRRADESIALVPGIGEVSGAMTMSSDGRPGTVFVEDMLQNSLSVSPDGLRVAISGRRPGDQTESAFDIWAYEIFTNETVWSDNNRVVVSTDRAARRLTFEAGSEVAPVWSPDGEHIAYGRLFASTVGDVGLLVRPVAGGAERMLVPATSVDTSLQPSDWTRDGKWIICHRGSFLSAGEGDIIAVPAEGGEPIELVVAPNEQNYGRVSANGKWLAYTGNEAGPRQVYVIPFEPGWEHERREGLPAPAPGARWRVSLSGGQMPRWGPLGRTLYFVSSSNSVIVINWREERGAFVHDTGRALFDYPFDESMEFDVFPNEGVFAVNTEVAETASSTVHLVLNWPALLE